jgi:cytochrome c peroxidase
MEKPAARLCRVIAISSATALGCAAWLAASAAAPSDLHGAQPMDKQMAQLHQLFAGRNPDQPVAQLPPTVDPGVWASQVVPADNEITPGRVALGKKLYFDTRLSADGTVACATCHDVGKGFTDQRQTSEGIRDQHGKRNAPTTLNVMFFQTLFWDGRAPSLEEQAKLPILNPVEMGQPTQAEAVEAIAKDPQYLKMFQEAYGHEPNYEDLARAIATFERTLVFMDAPFDRFLAGDPHAISEQAKRGWALFNGKGRCASCHMLNPSQPIGTDNRFHNIGVAARHQNFEALARRALEALSGGGGVEAVDKLALQTDLSELGRFLVTKNPADIGAFKTEQLRNVGITAPYMHDGSLATLWDVMDHYNKGGEANPYLDGGIQPLALTSGEIDDMVAFLFTLTDERFAKQNAAARSQQMAMAAKKRPLRDNALADGIELPFQEPTKVDLSAYGGR